MEDTKLEIIRHLDSLISQTENTTRELRNIKEQLRIQYALESKERKHEGRNIQLKTPSPEWSDIATGKRFLTSKELGQYLGMSHHTIHNYVSAGKFPIRPKKIGKSLRFDMNEVLLYLETSEPFWERDSREKGIKKR